MRKEIPNPNSQPLDTGRVSTIELILSVIVAKVCPGAITAGECSRATSMWLSSGMVLLLLRSALQLRVRIPDLGQVCGTRPSVQVLQQAIIAVLCFQLGNLTAGIVDVAESDGACRARLLASRLQFEILNFAALALRIDAMVINSLNAIGALFHDAAAAYGDIRV